MVQITGTLYSPTGETSNKTPIRITATSCEGQVLVGAFKEEATTSAGLYDFNLLMGTFLLEIKYGDTWETVGHVTVDGDTASGIDLNQLIATYSSPVPDSYLADE